jgi:hypothetical protein
MKVRKTLKKKHMKTLIRKKSKVSALLDESEEENVEVSLIKSVDSL